MELRHLRYFLVVAEELNFTRAAARLGMSQPPLSQQIRDLEAEIAVPLFDRRPQGVVLTTAGETFLKEARATIEQAERAKSLARQAGEGASGMLRLGVTSTATFNPAPPRMIRAFRALYPDVAISMEEGRSIRLVERLLMDELDVVIVRPSVAIPQELRLRTFGSETLMVAMPADHRLAARQKVALLDLHQDPFIVLAKTICASFHDTALSTCRGAGFDPIIAQQAVRITSIIDLVAANLGVALVPESMARAQVDGVVFRKIEGEPTSVPLALAVRGDNISAIVANFLAAGPPISSLEGSVRRT
jgi:DNA-binding transcriptional LysR family regulator